MTEAAIRGAIGSVAILLRLLRGRVFFDVLETVHLTPHWDPEEPDRLLRVTEKYKVPGELLVSNGYQVSNPSGEYWFTREWDTTGESWFVPLPVGSPDTAAVDQTRSGQHNLGLVPTVWIRNLPGLSSTGDPAEGACTFRAAIETQIERVTPRIPALHAAYVEKLSARLREAGLDPDAERLKQELALFATKIDVAEEVARLATHFFEVRRVLRAGGSAGKRLDFLMQELHREANTLGSKSVDAELSQGALEIKVLIEQMREQVQNLE